MASLKADNNRVAWTYTDDNAEPFTISAKAVYVLDGTDGSKFGGEAGSTDDRRIPKEMKPRRVKCVSAGKPDKWMIAYATTATIWTTAGTTLTLDCNGTDTVYATTKTKRGERSRDTTRQTA
jgi:hypothetical protein